MSSYSNVPVSTGGDTGRRFVMDSSSFAPAPTRRKNKMHLANVEITDVLSMDEVAMIFSFLPHQDIMRARVCRAWREAATKTLVPLSDFVVDSKNVKSYNAMRAMSSALPNLQWMKIFHEEEEDTSDSDSDEESNAAADLFVEATNILPNFTKLRTLVIQNVESDYYCPLSERHPPGLSNFPLLRNLRISCGWNWDLEMLTALPLLEALELQDNPQLTGNLSSLKSLKDILKKVTIKDCQGIKGNFMDLADFPRLKELDLFSTAVMGDIRVIRECDFPALEILRLPPTVHGGTGYEFQRVSDVPSFMQAIHFLLQRNPTLFKHLVHDEDGLCLCWSLSRASPDWYWYDWDVATDQHSPPFYLRLVHAGSRLGWSWYGFEVEVEGALLSRFSCEVNWLDPESKQHEKCGNRFDGTCIPTLNEVQDEISFYRGYHEPPNELEYRRLCEGWEWE